MASTKKARFNKSNNQCLPRREQSITKAQLHQNGAGGWRGTRQQLNVQLVFFILLKYYGIKVLKKHKMVQEEGGGLDSNLMSSLSSLYGRQVNLARVH